MPAAELGEIARAGSFATDADYHFHQAEAAEKIKLLGGMSSMKRNAHMRGGETYLQAARATIMTSRLSQNEKDALLAKWRNLGGRD